MAENRATYSDPESEKFKKYLIEITVNDKPYYSVWFTDMSSQAQQDKLLVSGTGNILVFSTIAGLKIYIQNSLQFLPDSENFTQWITHYRADTPYAVNDIEEVRRSVMKFESVETLPKEDALNQIDIFNLIGDYRDLVNDSYLEEKMDDPVMSEFFDSAYTFHFWRTPEDAKDPEIDGERFKIVFNEIIDYFVSRIQFE